PASASTAGALLRAHRLELRLGEGSLASPDAPLTIDTGSGSGDAATAGLALRLEGSGAGASIQEVSGDLQLVLPTRFSGDHAVALEGNLQLEVAAGDLLDGTAGLVNPVDATALENQHQRFLIRGDASDATDPALQRAQAELAQQDADDHRDYWITYRGWQLNADGSWQAPATANHPEAEFTFTEPELTALGQQGYTTSAISTRQQTLQAIHREQGQGGDPTGGYRRSASAQQAYIAQRVVGTNTYNQPLSPDLYSLLYPQQAAERDLPQGGTSTSAAGPAAIRSGSLQLAASGAIGRSSGLLQLDIPGGDLEALSANAAQRLSAAAPSDVVGQLYLIHEYIGTTPLATGSDDATLDLANPQLFRTYRPTAIAGEGPLYQFIGAASQTVDLTVVDFLARDEDGNPLWQPISAGTPTYDTTATGASIAPNELVIDTRAELEDGAVVLARTPAFYGHYRYSGPMARLELQKQDFGDTSRWTPLSIGTQEATATPGNHPATLEPGQLITDPHRLSGVTLRLNTPLALETTGSVSAVAGTDLRLRANGALTINAIRASGLLSLTADHLSQTANGTGLSNDRGAIELRAITGAIGSDGAPLLVATEAIASLHASATTDAYLAGATSADLALGSLVAGGILAIRSAGSLRDAGRQASAIGQASINLRAPDLRLEAAGLGTPVSPLLIGGGSTSQPTAIRATTSGSGGVMALGSRGNTPVWISDLTATGGSLWLSGDGFSGSTAAGPLIRAGTLVVDGLQGLGSSSAPLSIAVGTLAGAVGGGGAHLTNSGSLAIDTAGDRTGTRTFQGLSIGGPSILTTSSGDLALRGRLESRGGDLRLSGAADLELAATGALVTAGHGSLTLEAGATGLLQAQSGSRLELGSNGPATLSGGAVVLKGTIDAQGPLVLHPLGSGRPLGSQLTEGQRQALVDTGVDAALLNGEASDGELHTDLVLDGTITVRHSSGFRLSHGGLVPLLGSLDVTAGPLEFASSSLDGLMVLGSLSASSDLALRATAGPVRSTVPSTLRSTSTAASGITIASAGTAALYGSVLAGAESTPTGPHWRAAPTTPASLAITSATGLILAGATAVAGGSSLEAPTITITASGGVISRGDLAISATGSGSGQGLFSSGLLVAGGTVNTSLSDLTPSSASGTTSSSTTSVQGSTLQAANIVLDPSSNATLSLSVSRDAADALVLGGSTSGSGSNPIDLVVAGAWMAAPKVSLRAPQSPRLLHDLIARDKLTITATSPTAANNSIRLSPLAPVQLGQADGSTASSAVELSAASIHLPGDGAGLALESITSAPQAFLNGQLTQPLTLNLAVTRPASGTAGGTETKTVSATIAAQTAASLSALIATINNAISSAASAVGLEATKGEIPVLDLRGAFVRLTLRPPSGSTRLVPGLALALNSTSSSGLSQLGSFGSAATVQASTPATILTRAKDTRLDLGSASQRFTSLQWDGGVRSTNSDASSRVSWTLWPVSSYATMNLNAPIDVPVVSLTPDGGNGAVANLLANFNLLGRTKTFEISQAGDLIISALADVAAAPNLPDLAYTSTAGSLTL
ncbi:MAG: beta strand repeat-containing protein, partial [Prochlorococcaceae cyanobacterium]